MNIEVISNEMVQNLEKIEKIVKQKNDTLTKIEELANKHKDGTLNDFQFKSEMNKLIGDVPQKVILDDYDEDILDNLKQLRRLNNQVYKSFYKGKEVQTEKKKLFPFLKETTKEEELFKQQMKDFLKDYKKRKYEATKEEIFTVYKSTELGKLANAFFENYSLNIIQKYPGFYKKLHEDLAISNIPILSRTYFSIILFLTMLVTISTLVVTVILLFKTNSILMITLKSFMLALLFGIGTFFLVYYYPSSVAKSRIKHIKNEIPFMIIHMAAIAGSGANPSSIFKLLLSSKDYPELSGDIKKIVNYINLFGYDLSTALRAVSKTTPSKDFSDLLNGIVTTVSTGGNLKDFLKSKADESLTTYKLERKKYLETLSAYSDIYTGVMIAAPLLFIVVLAIINSIGGTIGGFTVATIANVGTFGVIPLLNVIFILFVSAMQPE